MKISDLGEQELIKKIAEITGVPDIEDGLGIGDDAALSTVGAQNYLVTSKDLFIEDIHFKKNAVSAVDLGYKALAVNISDLAAMGAAPRFAFVGLAIPKDTELEFILDLYKGMQSLANEHKVIIAGGDTVASPGPLMLSITVQGEVKRGQELLRSGANPGDLICLSGYPGVSAAGLILLLNKEAKCSDKNSKIALKAHLRPTPRVQEGMYFAASGKVSAAMDTSDGIIKDLSEICAQSKYGALLYETQIPLHDAVIEIASKRKLSPLELALNGGEDYELLFSVPYAAADEFFTAYTEKFQNKLHIIGEITVEDGIYMITSEGKREKLSFTGYQHF